MPNPQKWHLILSNGEATQVDDVAKVEGNQDNFTFTNAAGEVVCFVDRNSLVLAKQLDRR